MSGEIRHQTTSKNKFGELVNHRKISEIYDSEETRTGPKEYIYYKNDVSVSLNTFSPGSIGVVSIPPSYNILKELILEISLDITSNKFHHSDYYAHSFIERLSYLLPGSERQYFSSDLLTLLSNQGSEDSDMSNVYNYACGNAPKIIPVGESIFIIVPLPCSSFGKKDKEAFPFPLHMLTQPLEIQFEWAREYSNTSGTVGWSLPNQPKVTSARLHFNYGELSERKEYKDKVHKYNNYGYYQSTYECATIVHQLAVPSGLDTQSRFYGVDNQTTGLYPVWSKINYTTGLVEEHHTGTQNVISNPNGSGKGFSIQLPSFRSGETVGFYIYATSEFLGFSTNGATVSDPPYYSCMKNRVHDVRDLELKFAGVTIYKDYKGSTGNLINHLLITDNMLTSNSCNLTTSTDNTLPDEFNYPNNRNFARYVPINNKHINMIQRKYELGANFDNSTLTITGNLGCSSFHTDHPPIVGADRNYFIIKNTVHIVQVLNGIVQYYGTGTIMAN